MLRIDEVDRDAAAPRFIDDDACIGVEVVVGGFGAGIQRLVDRVFRLDAEHRHPLETHLFVQTDDGSVVVHDGEIHVVAAARGEMIGEARRQGAADAGMGCLRVDGQRPQAGTVFHVIECTVVVDAHHRADDFARALVLGDEMRQHLGRDLREDEVRSRRHHVAARQQVPDGFGVGTALGAAHAEAARQDPRCPVRVQPEPVGV